MSLDASVPQAIGGHDRSDAGRLLETKLLRYTGRLRIGWRFTACLSVDRLVVGLALATIATAAGGATASTEVLLGSGDIRTECVLGVEVTTDAATSVRRGRRIVQTACGTCEIGLRLRTNLDVAGGCRAATVEDVLVIGNTERTHLDTEWRTIRIPLGKRSRRKHRLDLIALGPRRRVDTDRIDIVCRASGQACCGNARLDAGEACDDGNPTDGDGCDHTCTPTGCGNGVASAGEDCDDGNRVDGDGCDTNCLPTRCGNGIRTSDEACEPGTVPCDDPADVCDATTCACTPRSACTCETAAGAPLTASHTLTFAWVPTGEPRGVVRAGPDDLLSILDGALYVGGGDVSIDPVTTLAAGGPIALSATCDGDTLRLAGMAVPIAGQTCTTTGCAFGPPICKSASGIDTCLVNTFAATATGAVACGTPEWHTALRLPLHAEVSFAACPTCGNGVCQGGARNGLACAPSEAPGCAGGATSRDCPPDAATPKFVIDVPDVALTTAATERAASAGTFCGFCRSPTTGCFQGDPSIGCGSGSGVAVACDATHPCGDAAYPVCEQRSPGAFAFSDADLITTMGTPPGPFAGLSRPAALAGSFCLPPTFSEDIAVPGGINFAVDANLSLPGPAAMGLAGTVALTPVPGAP